MTGQMDKHRSAKPAGLKERDAEEWSLSEYLTSRVCGEVTGRSHEECLYNFPHDTYFVGNLRNRGDRRSDEQQGDGLQDAFDELRSKLAPVAFGADMRMETQGDVVEVVTTVEWSAYYRVFPTFDQQREQQHVHPGGSTGADTVPETTNGDEPLSEDTTLEGSAAYADEEEKQAIIEEAERDEEQAQRDSPEVVASEYDRAEARKENRNQQKDDLVFRFRKVPCEARARITLRRTESGEWTADCRDLKRVLAEETERARKVAVADSDNLRTKGESHVRVKVPAQALKTSTSYDSFLNSLQNPVEPDWRWEVEAEVKQDSENEITLSVQFVNVSPGREVPRKGSGKARRGKSNPNIEPFLFDTRASFTLQAATLKPFKIDLAPKGFRYDNRMWGRGFNCAVSLVEDERSTLETTHTPVHEQMRYDTRTDPPARFDALAEEPTGVLNDILRAMEDYLSKWDAARGRYVSRDPSWENKHGAEFDEDRQAFEREISRFRRGCDMIRDDADVREAFRLTNEAFRDVGKDPRPDKPDKESWRLFQVVFLVSQIPGMMALKDPTEPDAEEREYVDIVYFPTGGGKTEAYLAAMVFHCFFDRLRGKAAGVTAWIRFPLRFLTLQQTQRVADVVAAADLVRRRHRDVRLSGSNVASFAVGYFVGESSTPNELYDPEKYDYADYNAQVKWNIANDPAARREWRRLLYCPSCRSQDIEVAFDPEKIRVIHRCTTEGCPFTKPGFIPVYVVDNEVYRFLPSIMVGTIDKLAGVGNQRKMSLVFGDVDGRCIKHGYYKDTCCQKDCKDGELLGTDKPQGLSGPTLFVQDELHLLKEGLGTFDGHYETFVQELKRQRGEEVPLKIIASSATIENFERQARHLYGRPEEKARMFPGPGPTLEESFYAETQEYPQRVFVGLIPHNKTLFNAALELLEAYHRETQRLLTAKPGSPNPWGGTRTPGSAEWHELLDPYLTSLTFFEAKKTLSSIRTDIESEVNRNLIEDGFAALEIRELSGGTSTDEITRILEHLEKRVEAGDMGSDALLATNMVSHGVDVNRLNAMFFYGMPRQTAEYIQASSRVGRAHVGNVFTCLHPVRERDQSHYGYFDKYHEFMGQLVEPVAINRWAKHSIRRTLPGLFMGVMLQLIAARDSGKGSSYYFKDFVQQKISKTELRVEDFVDVLEKAYMVDNDDSPGAKDFRKEISKRVERFFDQIRSAGWGDDSNFVSAALRPKPMNSLRDFDEPLDIELDATGSQWANRASRR